MTLPNSHIDAHVPQGARATCTCCPNSKLLIAIPIIDAD